MRKGAAVAAFDKGIALASKQQRGRAKKAARAGKQFKAKPGDKVLSAIAAVGRLSLGAVPKARKIPRANAGESFAHALSDPFSIEARGARVPDLYAFPTNTFRLQTSMLLGTSQTEFGAVFFPNPYASVLDTGVAATGVPSITGLGGVRRFAGASAIAGMTVSSLFTPLATEYRTVGGGIKIRNLLPELTATGRVYIAVLPVANGGMPNWNMLEASGGITAANYNSILSRLGLPILGALRSASLQMQPVAKDFTVGQIVGDEEIEIDFSIYHPDFFRFKPTQAADTELSATLREVDDVAINIATGTVNQSSMGNKEATQSDGGSAIVVWFEGIPSTSSAPFEIDLCLHLECVPLVAVGGTLSGSGITPESDNPPRPVHGCTAVVEHEITRAREDPDSIIRLNKNDRGAGGARIADID